MSTQKPKRSYILPAMSLAMIVALSACGGEATRIMLLETMLLKTMLPGSRKIRQQPAVVKRSS